MSKENLVKEIIRKKLSEAGMSSKFRKAAEEYKEVSLKLQDLYADRAKALEGYKKAEGGEKEKYKNELSRIQKLVSPLQAQMEKAERVFNKALLSEPEELEETIDDDGMERVAAGLPQTEEEPVSEATADAIAKDLDKVKGELLKKVAELVAKKKKLYSNVDISSPMSAEEKKLDKEIADTFSQINQLVKQRRDVKTESVTEAKFKHINTGEKTINKKVMDKVKETFPTMKSVKKKNVPNMGEVLYIHDGDGNGIGQVYVDKQHGVVIDVKEGVSEALNPVAGEWVLFKTMGSFSKPSRKMKFVSLQKSHRSAQIAMKKALDKMNRNDEYGGYGIMSKDKWDKEDSRFKVESVSEGKNDKKIKELEAKLAAVKGKTPGDEGRRAAIRDDIERLKAESVSEARRPPDDWYAEVLQDAIISKLKGKAVNGWKMGIDLELGTFKYTKNGFDFVVYITPFEEEDRFITVSAYDYESEEVDYLQGALGKYKHPLNPTYDVDKDVSKYISFVTKLLTKVEKAHKLNTESVSEGKKFGSKYDIGMGRMGSGVTVWNRLQKQGGDYKTIAHISDAGKVSFRDKSLPDDVKKYIEDYAKKGMNEMVNEASKRANEFFGDSKHGQEIHKMLKGKWDAKKVDGYLEELGGGSIQKNLRIIDFITKAAGLNPRKYDTQTLGKQISDLLNTLEVLYKDFANATNVKKFDDVRIKSKNLIGMVYAISGNNLVVRTANGLVKATKDDVEPVLSDGVMKEGNAFGMAVTQAKKDGKKEFEFNGKTYKVKKGSIEENEKETISESDGVKKNESVNEVDYNSALASFNAELGENEAVKKIASYYAVSVKIVVNNLQSKIKVSRYSDKSIKSIDIDFTETETKIKVKHSKQFKNEVNVNESDCGCGAKVVVSEAVNVRKLLQMNVARELKVSPSSIEVGVGGYGSRTANDGSQVVVIGLDSNVKKISIPQADYFDKTVDYGGYLIVKADGKTGKLLKVLDRVKSQNDIRMMDYIKEVNENITEAVKEPEVITKLRDIVNRRGYATIKDPVTKKNVKVDTFSASAIIQVYDAVNDTNKQKLAALSIPKMASVAFKLAK